MHLTKEMIQTAHNLQQFFLFANINRVFRVAISLLNLYAETDKRGCSLFVRELDGEIKEVQVERESGKIWLR